MKTLKYLIGAAASLAVLGIATSASAATIVGSKHDLTTATGAAFSTTGDTAEVCVFCHSPHTELPGAKPLWNRGDTAGGYTMYSNTTIDMTIQGAPESVSLACLSCHDGTIGFDQLINATTSVSGTYNYVAAGADQAWTFTGDDSLINQPAPVLFGTDLSGDHPISVVYDETLDTAFNAPDVNGYVNGELPLYAGTGAEQVECGTCHNPHDSAVVPFLRKSNAASALCTTCHIK